MVQNIVILFLISASGVLLFFLKRIPLTLIHFLIALGAGSMLSVSIVHILPESLEQSEFALYSFLAGFIVIYLIEELLTPHHHDHIHGDHTHEDQHEHYEHVALISFIAIFLHTVFDGIGMRAGFGISETVGTMVLFAVCIHQIPVSFSLAALLAESAYKRNVRIILLLIIASAAPLGYILSDVILVQTSHFLTGIAIAFAGGSLLYISTTDLLPLLHERRMYKYHTILFFLVGVTGITLLKSLEGGHTHSEELLPEIDHHHEEVMQL